MTSPYFSFLLLKITEDSSGAEMGQGIGVRSMAGRKILYLREFFSMKPAKKAIA